MMSSSTNVRQRRIQQNQETSDLSQESPSQADQEGTARNEKFSCWTWMLILIFFFSYLVVLHLLSNSSLPLVKTISDSDPKDFTEERAWKHLESFVNLGGRFAGSHENDVLIVEYILSVVGKVKNSAHKSKNVEVDVQRPTGSFTINFLDGFTSYYSNISNTVVRISSPSSSEHALLLNCHTDTLINTPGASDDAVACAIMLEILRVVAIDEIPLIHPLILLFNGAEENILQASHGFITQHKWAKQVQAFINLEAAGAGGKEFVFQTGPENPWLVWAWAKNAPHPHGSSVGQDLFQSGIIPSDTDFRIYRDYGKIPGVDLAYIQNGYVYHTYHDSADKIQPGCVQRAGENILAVARHLVQSPESLLADPSAYRHGGAAFFDFLGLFFAVISLRLLTIINYFAIASVLAYIGQRMLHPTVAGFSGFDYNSTILKAIAVNIFSFIGCTLSLVFMATFLTKSGKAMSWFSNPLLILGLYLPPALIGLVSVHGVAKATLFKNIEPWKTEGVFFDAMLVMWTSFLFQTRNIGSSYMFLSFVITAVIGRGFLVRHIFSKNSDASARKRLIIHLIILILPCILWVSKAWLLISFFIPITGRSGSELSPEVYIFALVGIFTIACFSFQIGSIYLVDSLKWFYIVMVACLALSLSIAFSDIGFPYRGDETSPTLKRFYVQHTTREFYGAGGHLDRTDSGLFVSYMDFVAKHYDLGPKILMESSMYPCKGSYCELPFLLPLQTLVRKNQYIPVPSPPQTVTTDLYPFTVKWSRVDLQQEEDDDEDIHHIKVQVSVEGPPHMALHITPQKSTLEDWSFDGDIELARSKHSPTEMYFVYYGGGLIHPVWEFWLQFAVSSADDWRSAEKESPIVELAVTAHYTPSGPVSKVNNQTPQLRKITMQLNDWLAPMSWVSLYRNYII